MTDFVSPEELRAMYDAAAGAAQNGGSRGASDRADDDDPGLAEVPEYPVSALPDAARPLVEHYSDHGLPAALLGGSVLAAAAAAIGPNSYVEVDHGWQERPILWVVNLAPRGAGKSPAQSIAFGKLRAHDAAVADDEPTIRLGDLTLEALARALAERDGGAVLDVDELAQLLRGLGEYKGGGGGDRGRLLSLWSGAPWSIQRVGANRKQGLGVDLRIARPTLVICGGLQPGLHDLLGGDEDGLRPRWLPHLAAMPEDLPESLGVLYDSAWPDAIDSLVDARDVGRGWTLSDGARAAWTRWRKHWKRQALGAEPASVTAALSKADVHLARVALVFAELKCPAGPDTVIGADTMERAAEVIEFTLTCWRALPEHGEGLGLSRRDQILNRAVVKLVAWLEARPKGKATRREIQRAHVAGVRKASDLDALLADYEATFPGSVTTERPPDGGLLATVVSAPRRKAHITVSPFGDTDTSASENPHGKGKSGGVTTGDTATGDTDSGDTAPARLWDAPTNAIYGLDDAG